MMPLEKNRTAIESTGRFKIGPDIGICLFLFVVILAVYGQINTHDFIGYDDDKYVTENIHVIQGLSLKNLVWAFQSTHASNWHPLAWLSHMLDVELFGMNPGAHHMTNVFFHILNSLLLFVVLRKMAAHLWPSAVVALLFALHPLHVESVAWVAERKDVLSTFWGLLTFWGYYRYIQRPGTVRYLWVTGFFALALMTKPMLVTLPFLLLLIDYWPLGRFQPAPFAAAADSPAHTYSELRLVVEKIPLFLLSGLSSAVTFWAQYKGNAVGLGDVHPLATRVANALVAYVKYILKMFWPDNLAVLYPYPNVIIGWQVLAAFLVLGGITFLSLRYRKNLPWLFVGWFWYVGTLVPVIGLIQVGVQAMADRYTYLPLVGLFVIVSWGMDHLTGSWRQKKIALSAALVVLCVLLVTSTRAQVRYWKNSITLFEHALAVTADNYVLHNNLGFELALQGKTDAAIAHYRAALRINPEFEQASINLGSVLFWQGKRQESFAHYREVLTTKPDFVGVRYNFGVQLLRAGEIDAAVDQFQAALRIKPDYAEVYNSLGAARVSQGKLLEAMANFRQAIRIKPGLLEAKTNLKNLSAALKRGAANQKIELDFQ